MSFSYLPYPTIFKPGNYSSRNGPSFGERPEYPLPTDKITRSYGALSAATLSTNPRRLQSIIDAQYAFAYTDYQPEFLNQRSENHNNYQLGKAAYESLVASANQLPKTRSFETLSNGYIVIIPDLSKDTTYQANKGPVIVNSSPFTGSMISSTLGLLGNDTSDDGIWSGGRAIAYGPTKYRDLISGGNPSDDGNILTYTYQPSGASQRLSNTIITGDFNDLVIYDGSQKYISLNGGDDIVIPSLNAFQPSIQFGKHIEDELKRDSTQIRTGKSTVNTGYFSNTTFKTGSSGAPFQIGSINYNQNLSTPDDKIQKLLNGYTLTPPSEGWSANGIYIVGINSYAKAVNIYSQNFAANSQIALGGQSISTGKGNDTLYGLVANLYANKNAILLDKNSGSYYDEISLRKTTPPHITKLWRNPKKTLNLKLLDSPHVDIQWSPVLLAGGKGNDDIYVGDLGSINLNNGSIISNQNGSTLYTILGDHDNISDVSSSERQKKSWGSDMSSDSIYLDAHYDYTTEVIQKGINVNFSSAGSSLDWASDAQLAAKSGKTAVDIAKAFGVNMPVVGAAFSVANLAVDLVKTFQKERQGHQDASDAYYRDEIKQNVVPPGSWGKAITFPDWDPLDSIVINTIPIQDPNVQQADKWSNINFSMIEESNQQMFPQSFGYTIEMQTALSDKKPLVYLSGLKSMKQGQGYGYKTFNFFNNKETYIDPIEHMTYLGTLASNAEADQLKVDYRESNYNNLEISKDENVFLWNSLGLSEKNLLNKYRSMATSIRMGVDTRQFGWFTDINLASDSTLEDPKVDATNSYFHFWDQSKKSWDKVSLEKLSTLEASDPLSQKSQLAKFEYWTAQDDHAGALLNASRSDADNNNKIQFYLSRNDGSVKDPVTGSWLSPKDQGYESAALDASNYAEALSLKDAGDGIIQYHIPEGLKLSPFIETTDADGTKDYVFAYNAVHAQDPKHTSSSTIQHAANGSLSFEDVIGGDYDYNDAFLDASLNPELASHIASAVYSQ
jgi:hypothetical protein